MSDLKKVIVTLPETLLEDLDELSRCKGASRSATVRDAVLFYLDAQKKLRIREEMEAGYRGMGALNLRIAEEGAAADEEAWNDYENALKE